MPNFFWSSLKNTLRYVDDIFVVFDKDEKCLQFLDVLNTQYKNIKFTMEHLLETIPFLDVEIKLLIPVLKHWFIRS